MLNASSRRIVKSGGGSRSGHHLQLAVRSTASALGFSPPCSPLRDSLGRRACRVQIGAALLRVEPACGTRTEVSLPAVISSHRCGHGPKLLAPSETAGPTRLVTHEAHRSHGRSGCLSVIPRRFKGSAISLQSRAPSYDLSLHSRRSATPEELSAPSSTYSEFEEGLRFALPPPCPFKALP